MTRPEAIALILSNFPDEIRAMNHLQNEGLVSDLAVRIEDCATADLVDAAKTFKPADHHKTE